MELGILIRRRVEVQDVEQVQDPDAERDDDEEHREVDEVEHVPRAREVPVESEEERGEVRGQTEAQRLVFVTRPSAHLYGPNAHIRMIVWIHIPNASV